MSFMNLETGDGKLLGLRQVLELKNFGELRIVENAILTEAGPNYLVNCTWRERLLSWPWRPWRKQRMATTRIPSKDVWVFESMGVMIMHPVVARALRDHLKHLPKGNGGMGNGLF